MIGSIALLAEPSPNPGMDPRMIAAIAASFAAAAAIAACITAILSFRIARRSLAVSRSSLLLTILKEYGQPDLGEALYTIGCFYDLNPGTAGARYSAAWTKTQSQMEEERDPALLKVFAGRRRVSHYFKNLVRLCDAGLLDEKVVAEAFGGRVFDRCMTVVVTLDEAHSLSAIEARDDSRWKKFYERWSSAAKEARKR